MQLVVLIYYNTCKEPLSEHTCGGRRCAGRGALGRGSSSFFTGDLTFTCSSHGLSEVTEADLRTQQTSFKLVEKM